MGFFKSLKKVFNPGGAIVSKVVGDGGDYKGVLDYAMNGQKQAEKNQAAQKAAQQSQYTQKPMFSPDPGLNPQAMQLGWTNGGYQYHNSPFNGSPPIGGPPMSFGGGGGQGLPPGPQGGSMPPAGAPLGQPTKQFRNPEQEALIAGLRRV